MATYGFEIYFVNVKTMRTIAQIFVAFSEKLNFNRGGIKCTHFVVYSGNSDMCIVS